MPIDKAILINQILSSSGLSENSPIYKFRKINLEKLSYEELTKIKNELPQNLKGKQTIPWDKGLSVERTRVTTSETFQNKKTSEHNLEQYLVKNAAKEEDKSIKSYEKAFGDFVKRRQNERDNPKDIRVLLSTKPDFDDLAKFVRNNKPEYCDERGLAYDIDKKHYEIYFDAKNGAWGYITYEYKDAQHEVIMGDTYKEFIYDKKGKPQEASKEWGEYRAQSKESLTYLLTLDTKIDIPTLIDNYGSFKTSRFSSYSVKKLNALVKNDDDSRILNVLLTDKTLKKPIDINFETSPIIGYVYSADDILRIMESDKAKNFILEQINSGKSFSKSDIKKLDENIFMELNSYKLSKTREIPDKIEDITLNNIANILDETEINKIFKEDDDLRHRIPAGEVANINGQLYVNDGDKLVKIDMTKEKFEELFPPADRHYIKQETLGDCALVTVFGALMDSPKGRAAIYKLFHQDGKDVSVVFPDINSPIKFKNGKPQRLAPISVWFEKGLPKIGLGSNHIFACKGLRMLEQAISFLDIQHAEDNDEWALEEDECVQDRFFMNRQLKRLYNIGPYEVLTRIVGSNNLAKNIYMFNPYAVKCGNAIQEAMSNPNSIIVYGTYEKIGVNPYSQIRNHAYHIVTNSNENGMVDISNPWRNNKVYQVPIADLVNYINLLYIVELK